MGLKGYRLWVMGQLDSTCRAPPHGGGSDGFGHAHGHRLVVHEVLEHRVVALQVAFLKGKI
jgi:hypothetical protein